MLTLGPVLVRPPTPGRGRRAHPRPGAPGHRPADRTLPRAARTRDGHPARRGEGPRRARGRRPGGLHRARATSCGRAARAERGRRASGRRLPRAPSCRPIMDHADDRRHHADATNGVAPTGRPVLERRADSRGRGRDHGVRRCDGPQRGVARLPSADELCGLIGPNGAGKTTLFDTISGIRHPTGGSIRFDGVDVTTRSVTWRARQGIRRTFQRQQTFGWLSVEDNVIVAHRVAGRRVAGWPRTYWSVSPEPRSREQARRRRVDEVLDLCGIADIARFPPPASPSARPGWPRWRGPLSTIHGCCCSTSRPRGWRRSRSRTSAIVDPAAVRRGALRRGAGRARRRLRHA